MLFVGLSYGAGTMPRLTKLVERGRYWHVKLRFGDGSPSDLVFEARALRPDTSWLHPWRKLRGGIVWSTAGEHALSGTHWFVVDPCTPEQEIVALSVARSLGDAPYDWASLGRFGLLVRLLAGDREARWSRRRVICSEAALIVLHAARLPVLTRVRPFRCAPQHFVYSEALHWWPGNVSLSEP